MMTMTRCDTATSLSYHRLGTTVSLYVLDRSGCSGMPPASWYSNQFQSHCDRFKLKRGEKVGGTSNPSRGEFPTWKYFCLKSFLFFLVTYTYHTKMIFAPIESCESWLSIGAKIIFVRGPDGDRFL